ncbi:MAG: MarR family transcriptional regulator [Thermomicrobiales bacterium]|nr:MarR family transcriptional regulator [Thermomicrobiales bacterium]
MSDTQHDIARCAGKLERSPDPAVNAWLGMARLVQQTERMLTASLKRHQLNAGQVDILATAASGDGLTQQELAGRLCHSKANVSQLLDKLERAGLVRRVPEGRAYRIHLTEEGRALLERVMPEQQRIIAEQFAGLPEAQRAHFFGLVAKIDPGSE